MKNKLFLSLALVASFALADFEGTVIDVHDGDTVKVSVKGFWGDTIYPIRMAGIDAPELKQDDGDLAQQNLKALVFGKKVYVQEHNRDKYGRVVGSVFVINNDCATGAAPHYLCSKKGYVFANLYQLHTGFAWYYGEYKKAWGEWEETAIVQEANARVNKLGIWKHCAMNPSDYRKIGKKKITKKQAQVICPK